MAELPGFHREFLLRKTALRLRRRPRLGRRVFIASTAVVVGDVRIGDRSSVWFNVVLRGDINRIVIGHDTNIQDNTVLHLADDPPCRLGNYVSVGHSAIVHACTVEDEVLVGMGAIVMDRAVIGTQSIVGAGALVTEGTRVPPGSLVLGAPARVSRVLTRKERAAIKRIALKYAALSALYLQLNEDV